SAIADAVEHRRHLRGADRMVVRKRQQADAVADLDLLRPRGNGAVEHLGCRAVREFAEEVVLDGPEMREAHLFPADRLRQHGMVRIALAARPPRLRHRNLVEQPELERTHTFSSRRDEPNERLEYTRSRRRATVLGPRLAPWPMRLAQHRCHNRRPTDADLAQHLETKALIE